jgi:chromatin remodeling complex protein RSC6
MATVKKAAPERKAAPTKKALPAKRAAPAKRATPAKKAAPAKRATPAKKAAPAKRATPAKRAAPAKRATPAKKVAPAKRATPAKKVAPAKRATPAKKAAPAKRATPAKKAAPAKKVSSSIQSPGLTRAASRLKLIQAMKKPGRVFTPSPKFAALIGSEPLAPKEAQRRVWEYAKNRSLISEQASVKRVKLDAKLKAAFFGKKKSRDRGDEGSKGDNPGPSISVYEFKKLLTKQLG